MFRLIFEAPQVKESDQRISTSSIEDYIGSLIFLRGPLVLSEARKSDADNEPWVMSNVTCFLISWRKYAPEPDNYKFVTDYVAHTRYVHDAFIKIFLRNVIYEVIVNYEDVCIYEMRHDGKHVLRRFEESDYNKQKKKKDQNFVYTS
jgi:hypothetical protein